jgi:flavin reductase (DIM6/NTAB) family NADH-FMN oxidoreductase RutF
MSDKKQQTVAFRNALGSFATGITVITALGKDGQKVGMTANSFNSVSLDPALVLWSVARDANCFDDFIGAESYAIHVLAADQEAMSNRFLKAVRTSLLIWNVPTVYQGCRSCPTIAPALNVKLRINMTAATILF